MHGMLELLHQYALRIAFQDEFAERAQGETLQGRHLVVEQRAEQLAARDGDAVGLPRGFEDQSILASKNTRSIPN